jgi:hypothetical protein
MDSYIEPSHTIFFKGWEYIGHGEASLDFGPGNGIRDIGRVIEYVSTSGVGTIIFEINTNFKNFTTVPVLFNFKK